MSKVLKRDDGFYIFGYECDNPHYKSEEITIRNQGPMTKICRDNKHYRPNTKLNITLFKLVPVKTMTNNEYLEQLESKELYNIKD